MSLNRIWNAVLVSASALGVMALAAVAGITLSGGAQFAGAAPQTVPVGSLGVGAHVAAPLSAPISTTGKVPGASTAAKPDALLEAVQLKDAPVPKRARVAPKAAAAKKASSAKRSSSSSSSRATSGSGWQTARVSWYGPGFYGNTMAGGGTLQRDSMVVAHRSLAFGTRVQFSYNGRTCTAVVMDRGPFVGGRMFDLGPGTANALGFSGVGTVKYRILGR